MRLRDALFSSESVTEGHPDKVCDQISDAVLDDCIRHDRTSRVALETAVKTGLVVLVGEITTPHGWGVLEQITAAGGGRPVVWPMPATAATPPSGAS